MSHPLIYGAGRLGRELARYLKDNNTAPVGFVDLRAASLGLVEQLDTLTLPQAKQRFLIDQPPVVIAIHNHMTSVAILRDEIHAAGFQDVVTLWEFCQHERWLPEAPYWLSPHFDWRSHQKEITQAYQLLEDDKSRTVFGEMLALRQRGDYSSLSATDFDEQYVPKGLPAYQQPMRLIDCGAYDGDTIRKFINHGYEIEEVIAFEPDPLSFARLESYLQTSNRGIAINAGTYRHKGSLQFSSLGTGASHLDSNGDLSIQIETIDDVCRDVQATIIKMDVEGAEAASLLGAKTVIEKCRPALAISVYHNPSDLWAIPLLINQFDLDYRFYLRSHGENGFDTVMYAYPA